MNVTSRAEVLSAVSSFFKEDAARRAAFAPGVTYIPATAKVIEEGDLVNLVDAALDMWLTSGRYSDAFETGLAAFVGRQEAFFVNSGSSANLLAYACLTSRVHGARALQRGDEVITAAAGFPTTVAPAVTYGAVPVFVDVCPDTLNARPADILAAVTPKTRVVALAHALGNPFEAKRLREECEARGLWLIEDNCDGLGSRLDGQLTGTFGHLATQSFYPAHHITTGEGGALLADSARLRTLARRFRDWGRDCYCAPGADNTCGRRFDQRFGGLPAGYDHKYVYSELGFNLKATDMQAAVGVSQLARLPEFTEARRRNYRFLAEGLEDLGELVAIQQALPGAEPSWFGFAMTLRDGSAADRVILQRFLEDNRIGTRLLFGGNLTKQPAFANVSYRIAGSLAVTDRIMDRTLWVGTHPGLDGARLTYMVEVLRRGLRQHAERLATARTR